MRSPKKKHGSKLRFDGDEKDSCADVPTEVNLLINHKALLSYYYTREKARNAVYVDGVLFEF